MKVIVATRDTSRWPEFAGSTWVRLQYVLGLSKLGVESFWVDRLSAIDPFTHPHSLEYLVERFDRTAEQFGFRDRYCIVYNRGEKHFGLPEQSLRTLIESSDLLLNISGHLPADSQLMSIRRRAYVDVDPGFTQIWAAQLDMGLNRHNCYFTVGMLARRASKSRWAGLIGSRSYRPSYSSNGRRASTNAASEWARSAIGAAANTRFTMPNTSAASAASTSSCCTFPRRRTGP
jgi:hypothetical protein